MVDIVLQRILECIGNKHGEAKKLALYLGIHPNVITNWKNGTNKSYKKHINQIADYFGVSVSYLLGEKDEKTKSDVNKKEYKLRSVARLQDENITVEEDNEIANFIEYLLSKREDK